MPPPHPSSSDEQRECEKEILTVLAGQLGVKFERQPTALGALRLDGYADGSPPLVVEVFAHVGPCKAGQKRKLARDMMKLLLAERRLGVTCRKVIAVVDEQAIAHAKRGWDGTFAAEFGIKLLRVELPLQRLDELRAVQLRQRRGASAHRPRNAQEKNA